MKNSFFICLVRVVFVIALFSVSCWAQTACPDLPSISPETSSKPPRFALLIGMSQYQNSAIKPLEDGEKNVALMEDVLTKNYAFPPENIKVLPGNQAKRKKFMDTFCEHLVGNARRFKNAVIVFYFSGHGTRYPNQKGDELDEQTDQMDEAWLPYDARTEGVFDILDDEMNDLLIELTAAKNQVENVTFIFDSCNSGSMIRGERREVAPDTRLREPYVRKFPFQDEGKLMGKYVQIAASMPSMPAFPTLKGTPPVKYGALTYHLAAALRLAHRNTTYRELMTDVSAAVSREEGFQVPNAEGDKDRPIFGGASQRADPFLKIIDVKDNLVMFEAGLAHGVNVGTQVAIYDKNAIEFIGDKGWLTNATVINVCNFMSVARMPKADANPKVAQVKKGESRLILSAPAFGGMPVKLDLRDESLNKSGAAEVRTSIRESLENDPLIKNQMVEFVEGTLLPSPATVPQPVTAEALLCQSQPRNPDENNAPVLRLKRGIVRDVFVSSPPMLAGKSSEVAEPEIAPGAEVYYLDDGSGLPVFGLYFLVNDVTTPKLVINYVGIYARRRNLETLENKNSTLNRKIKISLQKFRKETVIRNGNPENKFVPIETLANVSEVKLRTSEYYNLRIEHINNPVSAELFVTALMLGNNGKLKIVFPRLGRRDNIIPLKPTTACNIEGIFPCDTKPIRTTPPNGREIIKIFVTTKRGVIEALQAYEGSVAVIRGDENLLVKILNQSGLKTRDGNITLDSPNDWTVFSFSVFVCENTATCE